MKNVISSIVVTLVCLLGTVSVQAEDTKKYIYSDATSEQGWPQMEQALISKGWLQGDLILLQPLGDTMAEATKCNPSVCIREFFELNGVVKPGEAVPMWITVGHFKLVGQNGRGLELPASAVSASSASATATVANPESQPQVAVEDGVLKSLIEAMEYSKKELKGNKEALANVEAHLQNQLNEYKKTVDKNDAKLGQQIIATEQTIKSLGEQLAKVEQQVRMNESRTTFLEATADLLGIRMDTTETSVATLQAVQNVQGTRLSATETSVATLQARQDKQEIAIGALGEFAIAVSNAFNVFADGFAGMDKRVVGLEKQMDYAKYGIGALLILFIVGFICLTWRSRSSNKAIKDLENSMRVENSNLMNNLRRDYKKDLKDLEGKVSVFKDGLDLHLQESVGTRFEASPATPADTEKPVAAPVVAVPPKGTKPEGIPTVQYAELTADLIGKQTATA